MSYRMGLYGIYGEHTQEACPLYNEQNRRFVLANVPSQERDAQKYNVKILHRFHSALEHTFLWVVEADNPHLIEQLMAIRRFNTIKIVPLITFQDVVESLKKIEEGTFFPKNIEIG